MIYGNNPHLVKEMRLNLTCALSVAQDVTDPLPQSLVQSTEIFHTSLSQIISRLIGSC